MNKFFADFVLVSSALILITSVGLYLSYQNSPKISAVSTPQASQKTAYKDESGVAKYAYGACKTDKDCVPAGCSTQICSSDPNLITTCELRDDFADRSIYSCGCVEGYCAWYK